jgi:F0F1-type ATP synthase membrane subunit a
VLPLRLQANMKAHQLIALICFILAAAIYFLAVSTAGAVAVGFLGFAVELAGWAAWKAKD